MRVLLLSGNQEDYHYLVNRLKESSYPEVAVTFFSSKPELEIPADNDIAALFVTRETVSWLAQLDFPMGFPPLIMLGETIPPSFENLPNHLFIDHLSPGIYTGRDLDRLFRVMFILLKKSEELELHLSHMYFLLAQTPIIVMQFDPEGKIQHALGAGLRKLGFEAKEINGRGLTEVLPCIKVYQKPVVPGSIREFECGGRNGSFNWHLQGWMHFDPAGDGSGVLLALDNTFQKEMESQVRREREIANLYMRQAGILTLTTDASGVVKSVNNRAEVLLKQPAGKVIGKNLIQDFVNPLDREMLEKAMEDFSLDTKSTGINLEFKIQGKNGQIIPVSCHMNNLYSVNGEHSGFLFVCTDITKRAETEKKLFNSMIEGQEKERKRISSELHDGVGPMLSAIRIHLEAIKGKDSPGEQAKELEKSIRMIDSTIEELRRISQNLSPGPVEDFGLEVALKDFAIDIASHDQIEVEFSSHGVFDRLPRAIEVALFRIAQELVANALRHSEPQNLQIQLIRHDGYILLMVEDDGKGFSPEKSEKEKSGLGLRNITARVRALEGKFDLDSRIGKGTIATIELPVAYESEN